MLFHAYGWDRDTVDRLTVKQAELWFDEALAIQERAAEQQAYKMRELFVDILVATGLVTRA